MEKLLKKLQTLDYLNRYNFELYCNDNAKMICSSGVGACLIERGESYLNYDTNIYDIIKMICNRTPYYFEYHTISNQYVITNWKSNSQLFKSEERG